MILKSYKNISQSIQELIKYQQWLAIQNGVQLTSWQALKAGIISTTKVMLKWLITNPAGQIALVVGAIAGLVAIYDALTTSLSEAKENLKESITTFNETAKEIKNLNSELETTESRIKELQKLSDAGTISIADEAELETLKEQNKELARQIALKQRQQITDGKQALEDAQELSTKTVKSEYEFVVQSQKEGTMTGAQVLVEKELQLAMDAYNKYKNLLEDDSLSESQRKIYEDMLSDAESKVDEMYNILDAERQAYLDLNEAGYTLGSEDKERLKYLNGYNDVFLLWNHTLTQTKQSFESLNAEQQRSILLSQLLQKNIEEEYANAIVDAISDSDLSEYWDKDFSFIPPKMTDYATAKEYGKAYAEAWLNGVQTKIEKEEIDTLSITDTVNNINKKLKPALDSLVDTYTTLFSEEGYEWKPINIEEFASIREQLDSLSEEFGINVPTEDYEEFVKILSDTSTTSEQAQKAFDDLATSMINNSNVVELTDENFDVLRNSLENLGVTNANEVLEKIRDAEAKLIDEGINLENVNLDLAQSFIEEAGAADVASQYLQMHMLKKHIDNANPLNTYNSVEALEKECKALKITGDLLDKTAKLKSLFYAAERNLGTPNVLDEIKKTQSEINDLINNQYSYEFNFEFDGNTTGDNKDKSSSKDTKETFDWIETLISRIQRNITNLGKVVSATYRNWSTRNNALAQEMGEVNKEINAQMTAYNAYMQKANSVPLAEGYKELVRSGAYKISEITDEKLKEQIQEYEEWYNKALDASDAIEDLRANLAELAKTKFDNISAQYDEQISLITHNVSMLEGFVSQSEAAGYMASEVYYKAMAEKQQENIAQLQGEYSSLLSAFDEAVKSGAIQKYSEDWYSMLSSINDVELELQSATTQLIEFNQTLQQLSWEVFNRIQDSVSGISSEANFLIDILNSRDLHTDKGIITEEGLAVQGLHAVNYNTYMEQALAYADEMAKIEEEIVEDPYDLELVDRRNELLGLQQEAISNAMDEKEAIRDLVSEGYDKMLNSLDELINKRKEALQAEKNMYDYHNSISEKTTNISNLKKQLQAYSGDNSESAKATIQKLQISLADAEKDLKETEYEKYLSDQEEMLDSLYSQTEQWINERLDNIDGLVAEAVNATNKNAETISNAIHEVSNGYGYKLSDTMETIWDYEENAINGICTIVSVYGDILHDGNNIIAGNITNGTTSVVNAIGGLNSSMQSMISELKNLATTNKDSISQAQNTVVNNQSSSYPTNNSASNASVSGVGNPSSGSGNTNVETSKTPKGYYAKIGDEQIGNKYGYATEAMARYAAEVEINRRAEKAAEEASKNASGSPAIQIYNGVKSATISELTKKIKTPPFYAKGTSNANEGWGIFGEKGDEILIANDGSILLSSGATLYPFEGGEKVLNATETAEVLKNTTVPLNEQLFANGIDNSRISRSSNVNNNLSMVINMDNVSDVPGFVKALKTAIKSDSQCRKLIQAVTIDETVGKNSLSRNKF